MNRILFKEHSDTYEMDPRDPRFEHVRGVLRMGEGDIFDVGVVNGPAGKARIVFLTKETLRIEVQWGGIPPLPPPLHLVVGMCRPATARKILTTVPTLGVREITFLEAGRSDSAYSRSKLWTNGEWREFLLKGVEQAFDTHVPELHLCRDVSELPELLASGPSQLLALDVYEGTRSLGSVAIDPSSPVCLAIGPERGWNANDRKALRETGFELVYLNERVLRVETAVTVGLTLVLKAIGVF